MSERTEVQDTLESTFSFFFSLSLILSNFLFLCFCLSIVLVLESGTQGTSILTVYHWGLSLKWNDQNLKVTKNAIPTATNTMGHAPAKLLIANGIE